MQTTANYGLKKPDQSDAYNIQNENDNMDIIDRELGELDDKFGNINLDAANVTFTSSITAFSQLGKNKVNLALDYLFQLANNGKQYWVDVIGIPLLVTDTFATLKSKTQTIKNTIAANIVSKGVAANNTDSLTSLADAISRISIQSMGGKRFQSGTYEHTGTDSNIINLSGILDFTPSVVYGSCTVRYISSVDGNIKYASGLFGGCVNFGWMCQYINGGTRSYSSTGFPPIDNLYLILGGVNGTYNSVTANWVAYE